MRLEDATIVSNRERIKKQLSRVMLNGQQWAIKHHQSATIAELKIVDNVDWQGEIRLLDFLEQVGTSVRLSSMLGRESVQRRLDAEMGLSFTEFAYQLLQGYDFYHLFTHHNCRIQMGGSDQWGNIVSGIEIIGKLHSGGVADDGDDFAAFTFPLLTTSNGEKMGKSAGNAVWLDPEMTSPFDFYQYFVRLGDADADRLIPPMTFLSHEAIASARGEHGGAPERRVLQKTLAYEVTAFVHGPSEANEAVRASSLLFDQYDNIFTTPEDRQLLSKILKQSKRHVRLSRDVLEESSLLAILRRLLPDQSNSTDRRYRRVIIL